MKKILAILLVVGFVGIAGFGILTITHASSSGHSDCIFANASGVDCPEWGSTLSFINFHLGALQNLGTATLVNSLTFSIILLVILLSVIYFGIVTGYPPTNRLLLAKISDRGGENLTHFLSLRKSKRWLSLHENSPSI